MLSSPISWKAVSGEHYTDTACKVGVFYEYLSVRSKTSSKRYCCLYAKFEVLLTIMTGVDKNDTSLWC